MSTNDQAIDRMGISFVGRFQSVKKKKEVDLENREKKKRAVNPVMPKKISLEG